MGLTDGQYIKILRKMQHEYHPAGYKIFDYGDEGDKFYMIIEGSVSIWVP